MSKCPRECNVATKKCKQKKASAFKYKASVEEIDKAIEEEECVCEDDEDTEDDIYLQVLEYIQEVETKIEKKTDEEMYLHNSMPISMFSKRHHRSACLCANHGIMQ